MFMGEPRAASAAHADSMASLMASARYRHLQAVIVSSHDAEKHCVSGQHALVS